MTPPTTQARQADDGKAYILRIRDGARSWWVVFNRTDKLNGGLKESQAHVRLRWVEKHGRPTGWIRYQGIHRMSEAICTICDVQGWDESPCVIRLAEQVAPEKGGVA